MINGRTLRVPNLTRLPSSRPVRYGAALAISAAAIALRLALEPHLGSSFPFFATFIGVILSAWIGGFGPGMLATLLTAAGVNHFFLAGRHGFNLSEPALIQVGIFCLQGTLLSLLSQISRRRGAELETTSLLYETLLTSQSDLGEGAIFVDDGKVIYANEAVYRITGYGAEELDTLESLLAVVVPERRAYLEEQLALLTGDRIPETGPYEVTARHRDGRAVEVEVAVKPVSIGRHVHLIILVRDITERKAVQETLRRSEEHYRLLIENVRDYAIFTLKKNGTIASWNEGAERVFGHTEDDAIGKDFGFAFSEADQAAQIPREHLAKAAVQGSSTYESPGLRRDGTPFVGRGTVTPLWAEQGKLRGYVCVVQDVTEQKEREERVRHQALHDALTDLPNRTLFCDRVDQTITAAKRSGNQAAVVFLDLDKFKNVNDSLGHAVGDSLIREVSARLQGAVREQDTVSRFGGDEFTLLLPSVGGEEDCLRVVKKIFKALRPTFKVDGHELHINASLGLALYPRDGKDVQTLIRNADTALYQAKNLGRNCHQFYASTMNIQANRLLELENDMRFALDRGEFRLLYQPVIEAATGKITGVEALVRWQHPRFGIVGPTDFIPLAEESGVIDGLNEWIVKTACRQQEAWRQEGLPRLLMSVNVSARLLGHKDLTSRICNHVEEAGIDPASLELEVTESFAMLDVETAIRRLRQLKERGIRIAIDDFGTGHSSLSYLKRLPADTIKIDRSFVKGCADDPHDVAIIRAVIGIARGRGLKVTAEGVETSAQRDFLIGEGIDALQGFLFSQPLEAASLAELVLKTSTVDL